MRLLAYVVLIPAPEHMFGRESTPVILTCPINTVVLNMSNPNYHRCCIYFMVSQTSASGGCNGVLTNNNMGAPSACGGSTTVTFTYTVIACSPFITMSTDFLP